MSIAQVQQLLAEATAAYLKNGTDSEKEEVAYYAYKLYSLTHSKTQK